MNTEIIGQAAGKVWSALNGNGHMTIPELKNATMLTDAELFAAIGWLSRENKLAYDGDSIELL